MIWCILGYVFMGTIGHIFLTGVIGGIVAIKRGYHGDDIMELVVSLSQFSDVRMDEQHKRLHVKNAFGMIVWLIFYVATWPVEFMRELFLDIPDAIKMYETQHGIERL